MKNKKNSEETQESQNVDTYKVLVPRLAFEVEGNELDRHPIAKAIDSFSLRVRDIAWAFAVSVPHAQKSQYRLMRQLASRQRTQLSTIRKTQGTTQAEAIAAALDTSRSIEDLLKSEMPTTIVVGLFIQLFSEFDNFIGNLIRGISELDETLFYNLKREVTIGELKSLPTVDALRNDLLEKEIESLRRDSYTKQFQSLEKQYEIPLTKFDEWPLFIEASQRRHLFTHAGGIVSDQYISVCANNGHSVDSLNTKGTTLDLDQEYFFRSCRIVELTGTMLGQTLWRKIFPKTSELADHHLNHLVFERLRVEDFNGALRLSNFGLQPSLIKNASGVNRRIRVINKAIALSRLKKTEETRQLLAEEDWTDTLRDFTLARTVLEGDYNEAAQVMKKIGKEGELVNEGAYRIWPLFWDFRKSQEFLDAYNEIFGYSFSSTVMSKMTADDVPNEDKAAPPARKTVSKKPAPRKQSRRNSRTLEK